MNAYCPAAGVGPTSPAITAITPDLLPKLMLKDPWSVPQAAEIGKPELPQWGSWPVAHFYAQFCRE